MQLSVKKWLARSLAVVILGLILWWAIYHAPIAEIWAVIQQLRAWQILLIILANTLLYCLVTMRWWLIVNAIARHVPYLPLLRVRVSVFGVSYFTFGPQVGGEPLQVLFLQRRHGLTYTWATASVLMDKLLEFLVDFLLLPIGLAAIIHSRVLGGDSPVYTWLLIGLFLLVLWPPVHILLLYRHHYPLTALLHLIPFIPRKAKYVRFIRAAEWLAGDFCREHLVSLVAALAVSLLAGAGMVAEYTLMTTFLNIHLPFWNTVTAWAAGWLSFLMPLPGGLGALEASQVFVLGRFGIRSAAAISLILLMRGRDLSIGGLGLLLAGTAPWNKRAKRPESII